MSTAAARTPVPEGQGRILLVDDSAVARAVLARLIDASSTLAVVGAVGSAAAALSFLQTNRVDMILLDVQMPGRDGLAALPDLLAAGRGAKIMVVSSAAGEGAATTVQALALGAADTLVKPGPGERARRFEADLLDKVERLLSPGPATPVAPAPGRFPERPRATVVQPADAGPTIARSTNADAWDVVAIGASTGGIHALSRVLRGLPADVRTPILVTQHLPASFMPHFATQLALLAGRPCEVATDRLRIRPGRLVVAPGDAHMRLVRLPEGGAAIRLSTEPSPCGCLPAVDPMMVSVAEVYGARTLAVMLSGMGRDGAEGAAAVAGAGGCVVVQDRASSVVYGMPGAVVAAGCADAVLDPDAIGRLIAGRKRPA